MGNFTLFEVHLHGENGGGFQFGPTFSKSGSTDESEKTESSEKSRRFGRFRRSKSGDEDATDETEIEVEDGEMDETAGGKSASGKGALIAILFLLGAVMLVKKLRGGDSDETEVDLD
ncbi:hypothetical protein [Haladaptatus sp. DJG-WS-42]|uniref:hypothetical protein n=1 Tax=Haladaptatus sp. DJG-WS-42 TaxID=3120516 RepID=UPI0030D14A10